MADRGKPWAEYHNRSAKPSPETSVTAAREKFPERGGAKQCAEAFSRFIGKNVSPRQWSPWERGMRTPDETRLGQIAAFFDKTVEYMRRDSRDPVPSAPPSSPEVAPPYLSMSTPELLKAMCRDRVKAVYQVEVSVSSVRFVPCAGQEHYILSICSLIPQIEDKKVLQWLQRVIRAKTKTEVEDNTAQLYEINRKMGQMSKDRDVLLTLRLHGEIEADTYARKDGELRNLMKRLQLQQEGQARQKTEIGDVAMKVLELSQRLKEKWVKADIAEKRVILEIVCSNLAFKDASLEISMRKPFDVIAIVEGLNLKIGAGSGT
ncbi:MAG: hypothetical protein LBS00_10905 [Synergistaceae bacterium]|nr:hypothetical protein [Synergistaceae bacterium]